MTLLHSWIGGFLLFLIFNSLKVNNGPRVLNCLSISDAVVFQFICAELCGILEAYENSYFDIKLGVLKLPDSMVLARRFAPSIPSLSLKDMNVSSCLISISGV
ncbi:hypothetical protein WICMUC_005741 [Wickerhamomyces mucosus]|uniref:Secreted protein n=1 Tax=Wickerhamomyces mucosus TaxID=1378264 RepID=A0A9P8T408_9ASCO|nr:hypothetical protein WICMUC_005741 [Wickerhamomyces mucosus]